MHDLKTILPLLGRAGKRYLGKSNSPWGFSECPMRLVVLRVLVSTDFTTTPSFLLRAFRAHDPRRVSKAQT
ncbi:unnamed protein product [Allacma fusca]|uniref:Uncharacterized protein n=1 Tax=Allacma fusca TaxID=39272 RepID=A0A8J2Q7D5_9HEXA|nr:unnamed protein product [Allacma fusca]